MDISMKDWVSISDVQLKIRTTGGTSGSTSWSFWMDSGRGNMGQEWSGSVSAEVLREFMTLQGRPHTSQLKS